MGKIKQVTWIAMTIVLAFAFVLAPTAYADHDPDDGMDENNEELHPIYPSQALMELDIATADIISDGPYAKVTKNLAVAGHGVRLLQNATTDVWALDGYAYLGTFNSPCGDGTGENGSGVRIFNVSNPSKVTPAGVIPSVAGSRINDVKVAHMNSGTILVHSNEACAGGPGGFEVYEVSDPTNPVHLAHVQVDDSNAVLREGFGIVDVGVHNLFLFTQGNRDYVALQAEGEFGSFQIYELTDPRNPAFVSAWGAEELCTLSFCSSDPQNESDPDVILDTIFGWMRTGYGNSQNKYLHDMTVSADGTKAYLSNWDAGLVLLDISDPSDPTVISVALDPPNGSLDGEVNSHAAWPSEDGKIVVETEEDFNAWVSALPLSSFTFQELATNTIPGVGISTLAGDDFEANQTGNNVTVTATSVIVNSGPLAGNVYPAREGAGNQPKIADTGPISGEAIWIGQACNGDTILNESVFEAGDVAVVRRGACFFSEKLANAAELGASAIIVANNLRNDTPWGGVRIWDYSDPANPVLASTFNTVCSASASPIPECDLRGLWSVHNVIVETTDDGQVKAYFSYYSDGVLILDVSDPYNPVETARFHQSGSEFEATNGGIQNVWGIYKVPDQPWVYASDRNGGLYVLKEYGSGSGRTGQP